jgi:hypothetical protein
VSAHFDSSYFSQQAALPALACWPVLNAPPPAHAARPSTGHAALSPAQHEPCSEQQDGSAGAEQQGEWVSAGPSTVSPPAGGPENATYTPTPVASNAAARPTSNFMTMSFPRFSEGTTEKVYPIGERISSQE